MLSLLIGAHLVGDFLLQNNWMQRKSVSSLVCSVHVAAYSLPFLVLVMTGKAPDWLVGVILLQHWLQDRFALHLAWMEGFLQTPPDKWLAGPLFVDQAWHIGFMWALCLFFA
jgi:hypothetical protein